jgi:NADH-quinone oxidoreductase subunit H
MDLTVLLVSTIAKIVFVLAVTVGVFAPLLIWAERRQSAMIQDRVGPSRAGVRIGGKNITLIGLLHPLADALKMIWKEDFVPPNADRFLHAIAPMLTVATAIAVFAVIPFADTLWLGHGGDYLIDLGRGRMCWKPELGASCAQAYGQGTAIPLQIANLNVGILYVFAIAGTGVIGAALGGYASDNKYSLLGGLRAASQMVSYEVVLGLTLVGSFMIYDTLQLDQMVRWQQEHVWGVFVQPVAFFMYMFAAIAETKRVPFDLPEGESEIVGGYLTEYSGFKFGMFFMSEFVEIIALSAIAATIFFGGWHLPFLTEHGFELAGTMFHLPHGVVVGIQILAFLLKVVVFIWLQLMIRWTLPRFRYDQVMSLCWKILLPLSLINIMVTGIIVLMVG